MALTGSFITYGTGQIISGVLGDRISPKKLVSRGLLVTVLMNVLLPFLRQSLVDVRRVVCKRICAELYVAAYGADDEHSAFRTGLSKGIGTGVLGQLCRYDPAVSALAVDFGGTALEMGVLDLFRLRRSNAFGLERAGAGCSNRCKRKMSEDTKTKGCAVHPSDFGDYGSHCPAGYAPGRRYYLDAFLYFRNLQFG